MNAMKIGELPSGFNMRAFPLLTHCTFYLYADVFIPVVQYTYYNKSFDPDT